MVKYFSALDLLTLCISFILRETGPPSVNQTLTTFIVSALPFVPSDVWKDFVYSSIELIWEISMLKRNTSPSSKLSVWLYWSLVLLLLRRLSKIFGSILFIDPSFTSSQAFCIYQYNDSSRVVMRLLVQTNEWFIVWVYDWYQVRMISLLFYIRYVIMNWSNKDVTNDKIERFTVRLIGIY